MPDAPMSPEVFAEKLREIFSGDRGDDTEGQHIDADELLCKVLRSLSYTEGIEIFENAEKWYA